MELAAKRFEVSGGNLGTVVRVSSCVLMVRVATKTDPDDADEKARVST